MCGVDIDDVERINDIILRGPYPRSIRSTIRSIMKTYYSDFLDDEGKLKRLTKKMKYKSGVRDVLYSKEEVEKVLSVATPPIDLAIRIIWDTGLRRMTLMALTPRMVKKDGTIHISPRTPGNKAGIPFEVILSPSTHSHLKKWIKEKKIPPSHPIFFFHSDTKKNLDALTNRIITAAQRAGIPNPTHFGPHAIRHSHATYMLDVAGMSIEALSYELGHHHIETTQRYAKRRQNRFKKEYQAIRNFVALGKKEEVEKNEKIGKGI